MSYIACVFLKYFIVNLAFQETRATANILYLGDGADMISQILFNKITVLSALWKVQP